MKLEYESPEVLKKEILKIVGNFLNLNNYKVFLYGSRIRGDSFERSDIDIGIEGPEEIPAEITLQIKEAIEELPVLYKIDFVDFKTVSDKFKQEALRFTESLN